MKCQNCGTEFEGNVCPNGCATPQPQPQYQPQPQPQPPVKKPIPTWLIVLTLIIFFPVGITLMWTNCNWKQPIKIIITVFFALLVIFNIAGNGGNNSSTAGGDGSGQNGATTSTTATKSAEQIKQEFISSCEVMDYEAVARTPENYKGKNMKIRGEIVQVIEPTFGSEVVYRIAVTENEYGWWDDPVYVTYTLPEGSPKILQDDIVSFYGVCEGDHSYIGVLGSQVTIPKLSAKYAEIESE